MAKDEPQMKLNLRLQQIEVDSPTKHLKASESKKQAAKVSEPIAQKEGANQQAKAFYDETYYLTGMRENYLILISDSMHIIELPVGLIKANISIGDPIKLKLEYDVKRAQVDRKKFTGLQQDLIKQFGETD